MPFGEELIKEMVMASVFSLPLSQNSAMKGYKLMIQRVTKVAQASQSISSASQRFQTTCMVIGEW